MQKNLWQRGWIDKNSLLILYCFKINIVKNIIWLNLELKLIKITQFIHNQDDIVHHLDHTMRKQYNSWNSFKRTTIQPLRTKDDTNEINLQIQKLIDWKDNINIVEVFSSGYIILT